ncbi:MAG TPA: PIN domain-containing protein [Leptospiraceae bacterium]|nr:PIN domain-containing protein [Leptospiraceae bacterium]HMW04803.1 PIN domain-containing protein [Leptospiraceae bacterium]HMX35219.1 PIN domain-containing protein [Leptospiraceae bacterium]HMY33529.1 PIN domain-containing protein [Leptospiraceae bacterium]HMZ66116.1 PIN domain-containing protein [Leptospiraceae bacterium]
MYLIDTSVWIESLKKDSNLNIQRHFKVKEIFICLPVYQEILQGIREDSVFWAVKKALDHSQFLEETLTKETFEEAISIYRQARKKGITIRSTVDCIIASIAIRNHATIIHKDRDYSEISKFTALKEKNINTFL